MNNTEIRPYGNTQVAPADYTLTSSLDENNAQKGATAAAAYNLKRMITGDSTSVDVGTLTKQTLYIDGTNIRWLIQYAQQNDLRSVSYPVSEGDKIKVQMVGDGSMNFVIVTDATPVDLGPIDFADGEELRIITAAQGEVEIAVPANAAKVVFNWKSAFDTNPFSLTVVTNEGEVRRQIQEALGAGVSAFKNRIIVAANNTPSELKEFADYVCSGTHDEVPLNLAINSAIAKGYNILMLRGDYYLDEPTKTYASTADAFLLVDTSPPSGSTTSRSLLIEGENPAYGLHPMLHISNSAYEALDSSKQYSFLAVYDSTQYGGFVELKNFRIYYPSNQKKICALDFVRFGGYARVHSVSATAYTNGYNGQEVTISNPPAVAAEGCVGIKFIGKGPNGTYGSEITDCNFSGFNEGICINTEWTVCNHVCSIFCVTGWVFGKYTSTGIHSSTHPIVLINCGDERGVNLPYFHNTSGMQDIEMIAFSIERNAQNTPGKQLGNLAMERVPGSFRGRITYCTGQGSGNWVNVGFWTYGHGHGFVSVDTSHLPGGTTQQRSSYHRNYLQRYYDENVGKEIICVDETNNVWKDAAGNII